MLGRANVWRGKPQDPPRNPSRQLFSPPCCPDRYAFFSESDIISIILVFSLYLMDFFFLSKMGDGKRKKSLEESDGGKLRN